MKIAVTYEKMEKCFSTSDTEQFKLYGGKWRCNRFRSISTNGSGHGALAGFLVEHNVDTLICGGIGGGAQSVLAQAESGLRRRKRKRRRSSQRTVSRKPRL